MAIGAYTMAILVVKEGWSTWLAAPLGVGAAAAAGLLLGLPALRLRADYFAIVTIAFSEIVRYVATNEDSLTGGSQGTIALGEVGKAAQYNGQWERFQARVQGWLDVSSKRRRDARDRLGGGASCCSRSSGWRCARRGAECCARSARTRTRRPRSARTCSRTSSRCSRRLRARRHRRGLLRVAVLVLQPRRLPAAADVLRLDDRDPRRARPRLVGAGRRRSSSASSSPARASSTSRRSRTSTRPSAPTCA